MNVAHNPLLPRRVVQSLLGLILLALSQNPTFAIDSAGQFRFTTTNVIRVSEYGGTATATVTRLGGATGAVLIDYKTVEDTAKANTNYIANTNGVIVFTNYQMSATITVPILNDGGKTNKPVDFKIALSNPRLAPSDATIGVTPPQLNPAPQEATIRILDGDSNPANNQNAGVIFNFESHKRTVSEGNILQVNVRRVGTNSEACSVKVRSLPLHNYVLSPGSDYAIADVDHNVVDETLNWGVDDFDPKPFFITAASDSLVEFNEDLRLELYGASSGSILGAVGQMTVTIISANQPSGAVDRNFNANNNANTVPPFNPAPGANGSVYAVAVQQTGEFVIGGAFTAYNTTPRNRVARIQANGQLDTSFNPGSGADGFITDVKVNAGGKIIIGGGFSSYNGTQRNGVAQINPNGSLDDTFNPGLGVNGVVWALAVQGNNVFVAGDFNSVNGITRRNIAKLNSDGTVSGTFNTSVGANASIFALAVQPDGKVLIGGEFTSVGGLARNGIARLNSDGSVDTTFDPGIGLDNAVYALAIQSNGKVLAGGAFTSVNAFESAGIARFNFDGSVDETFQPGSGTDDTVYTIRVDQDSKIWIGGVFSSYNGTRRLGVARLFQEGYLDTATLDTAYNQFAGLPNEFAITPNNSVLAIAFSDGASSANGLIIGGAFAKVGGGNSRTDVLPRRNIAKLVGGSTTGPGNIGFSSSEYTADEGMDIFITLVRENGTLGRAGTKFIPQALLPTLGSGRTEEGSDFTFDPKYSIPVYRSALELVVPDRLVMASDGYSGQNNETFSSNDDVYISVLDDTAVEGNEVQHLRLVDPQTMATNLFTLLGGEHIPLGTALGRSKALLTVVDNDSLPSAISFLSTQYYINENEGSAVITLVRSNDLSSSIQVQFATTNGGNASVGSDYLGTNGTLTFNPSQTTRSFTVPIINDSEVENDETVKLRVLSVSGGASIATNEATLSIIDDDVPAGRVNFSSAVFNTKEDGGQATVTVTRTGGSAGSLSVQFVASNLVVSASNAVAGVDYTATNGTLSWNSGESTPKTFIVNINNNELVDGTRKVDLKLSNPTSGTNPMTNSLGGVSQAILNILDDDAYGRFSFNAGRYYANDNGGSVTLTILRTSGIAGQATVNYSFTNGTATNGLHFLGTNGTLVFPAGVSSTNITIPIIENIGNTPRNREFTVLLRSPSAGATLQSPSNAVVSISDHNLFNEPAGSVDTSFAPNPGADNFIYTVGLQADGMVLVGGDFTIVDGYARARFARLTTNSLLDAQFSGPTLGANSTVRSMAIQSDGRILLSGNFTNLNGTHLNYLGRVNANGLLDSSFNPGSAADSPVYSVAETFIAGQRKILVGGAFSTFNGIGRNGVARLNDNGTVDTTFAPILGANGTVYSVVPYPTNSSHAGKILIGGDFVAVNGQPRTRLARLHSDGSLDLTFDPGTGANNSVRSIVIQPDGRILAAGLFTNFNGQSFSRIVRVLDTGAIDSNFNVGSGANDSVYAMALQTDGKILLGGEFTSASGVTRQRITRLKADGTVDPTINFGSGANGFISSLIVQPDGKIVVAGGFSEFDGFARGGIARLHGGALSGSGSLEFTSGDFRFVESTNATILVRRRGGTAQTTSPVTVHFTTADGTATSLGTNADYTAVSSTVSFPEGETLKSIVVPILNDGRIESDETVHLTLSGATGGAVIASQPTSVLTILNDDSTISFSAATFRRQENAIDGVATITLVREGSLLGASFVRFRTVGTGTATAGVDYQSVDDFAIFGPGESNKTVTVSIVNDSVIEGDETANLQLSSFSAAQPGEIVAATLTIADDDFAPGTISFSQSSYITSEGAGHVNVTLIRTNGSTGVVGINYSTINSTASGGVDYTSSSGALVFSDSETTKTFAIPILQDAVVEGNETFLIQISNPVGGANIAGSASISIIIEDDEFGPGSLDRGFNPGAGANSLIKALAIQSDGKVLIGGAFTTYDGTNRNYLARLSPTGSLDLGFNAGSAANALVSSVGVLSNGKIAVAGSFTSFNGFALNRVARLNTNGTVDSSFSQPTGLNSAVHAMALQSDGKLVLGGAFSQPTLGTARLTSSGGSDIGYAVGSGADGSVHATLVQPDGNIVIAGDFNAVNGVVSPKVARIHANGLVDQSFTAPTVTGGRVYAVGMQYDGKLVIGGDFDLTDGVFTRSRIARLNVNGTIDTTFAPGAVNGTVFAIQLQHNGKVVLGGDFTRVAGEDRNRVARLNYDGTFDFGFDPGSGANNTVYNIRLLPDGKFLIVGDFTAVNGLVRNGIARLNGDNIRPILTMTGYAPGQVALSIQTIPTFHYQLQASDDLIDWVPIATYTAPGLPENGLVWNYTDTGEQLSSARFYRAVQSNP